MSVVRRSAVILVAVLLLAAPAVMAPAASATPKRPVAAGPRSRLTSSLAADAATVAPSKSGWNTVGAPVGPDGKVIVVAEGQNTAAVAAAVQKAGGEVRMTVPGKIKAYMPKNRLSELAADPAVSLVRPPYKPQLETVTSEGVAASGADVWQNGGNGGGGVTVAIVDAGFLNYAARETDGELPPSANVITDFSLCQDDPGETPFSTDHGTAVAEVVHDMAPAAALMLVCVGNDLDFLAVQGKLNAAGIRIVNASLGFDITGRGDSTGAIGSSAFDLPTYVAQSDRIDNNRLWIAAAGNDAANHWDGTTNDANKDLAVELGPSGDEFYSVTTIPGGVLCADLKWDQWPVTREDYDLFMYASPADYNALNPFSKALAYSTIDQAGALGGPPAPPIEYFCSQNDTGVSRTTYLMIYKFSATTHERFDLYVTGGNTAADVTNLEYKDPAGSVLDPAWSAYTMAVAASCWRNGVNAFYSSEGPTIDGRPKPDISAPTGVSTATYGLSTDPNCLDGFAGTSAASPHVAGAAALLLAANSTLDPTELQSLLEARATDAGAPGKDNVYGAGNLTMGACCTADPPVGSAYAPTAPVRLLDTRTTTGGHSGKIGPGESLSLHVSGTGTSVPADATAIVINLTIADPDAPSFLTVYPDGQQVPNASNLNFGPGDIAPNQVTATIGSGGNIRIYNLTGHTNVIVDLEGYYEPSAGSTYVATATPQRILDTRTTTGGHPGKVGPGEVMTLHVRGTGTSVPANATAVAINLTATEPTGRTFITVFPNGTTPPTASNLNVDPGQTRANSVTAIVGDDDMIRLYNLTGTVHLVADLAGYYVTDDSGARYVPLTPPVRALDTRHGNGGYLGPVLSGVASEFTLQARDVAYVPSNAVAVCVNLTVAQTTAYSYLTVWPDGQPFPNTSNLNWVPKQIVANAAIVTIGADGKFRYYNFAGETAAVTDVEGYFIPSPARATRSTRQ